MSFIRAKEIPPGSGRWYDYEVENHREGKHVRQKVLRYIGRSGGSASRGGLRGGSRVIAEPAPVIEQSRALPRGRVSANYIASALQEYYSGMSLHDIAENIQNLTDGDISHAAINKWVKKYTDKAIRATKDLKPNVGSIWVADETYLQTDQKEKDPKGVKFWDIIDAKTRFILATQVTTSRSTADAKRLMLAAAERAGKLPKIIVTDGLPAYIDGIEQAFGSDVQHKRGTPFKLHETGLSTALIERFHNTFKDRTKVMRDLRNRKTLDRFGEGWLVYYNFFRPHTALHGIPPAQKAGLEYDWHSWADVVEYEKDP